MCACAFIDPSLDRSATPLDRSSALAAPGHGSEGGSTLESPEYNIANTTVRVWCYVSTSYATYTTCDKREDTRIRLSSLLFTVVCRAGRCARVASHDNDVTCRGHTGGTRDATRCVARTRDRVEAASTSMRCSLPLRSLHSECTVAVAGPGRVTVGAQHTAESHVDAAAILSGCGVRHVRAAGAPDPPACLFARPEGSPRNEGVHAGPRHHCSDCRLLECVASGSWRCAVGRSRYSAAAVPSMAVAAGAGTAAMSPPSCGVNDQKRIVPSSPPDAYVLPSGVKRVPYTGPWWPLLQSSSSPATSSKARALSGHAVARAARGRQPRRPPRGPN